jgi:hypothetical protein
MVIKRTCLGKAVAFWSSNVQVQVLFHEGMKLVNTWGHQFFFTVSSKAKCLHVFLSISRQIFEQINKKLACSLSCSAVILFTAVILMCHVSVSVNVSLNWVKY